MKLLFKIIRPPVMLFGLVVELMLIQIAWVVRFVEEYTDEEAKLCTQ